MPILDALASFLGSYLLHSTVLLLLALAAERAGLLQRLAPAAVETVWRLALFGGLLTAAAQPLLLTGPEEAPAQGMPAAAAMFSVAEPEQDSPALEAPAPQPVDPSPVAPTTDYRALLGHAAAAATLAWLLVAVPGLAALLLQRAWLVRLVRRMPVNEDPALARSAAELSQLAGLRKPPPLRASVRWNSPLVAPGGTVCLPLWAQAELSPAQREAVLAHELAHLLRRDPAWRFAGQALVRLAWLQPLNHLALRRLDLLAELACDDWAARHTGQGQALAESLYLCARQQQGRREQRTPGLALAMSRATAPSPLLLRMRSLLENTSMTEEQAVAATTSGKPARRWRNILMAGAGLVLLAVLLPAVAIKTELGDGWGERFAGLVKDLGRGSSVTRIESNGPEGKLLITVRGSLKFNEDETDVQSVAGSLEIDDRRGGLTRKLNITSSDSGAQQRSYVRNGEAIATLDAADRKWLAEMVGTLIDATSSPAQRVERLMARGGLEAVFAHLDKNRGDYERRGIIEALVARGPLEPAAVDRLLLIIPSLGSDFEHRSALEALVRSQALSEAQQVTLLQATARIGSDFERRQVLEALSPKLASAAPVLDAWVEVVGAIGSDFEARSSVETLMEQSAASTAQVDAALRASEHIGGDFEHRSALQAIARRLDAAQPAQFQAYARSAARIGGEFERREALLTLLSQQGLDKPAFAAVLDAASTMGSGFEMLQVLTAVARQMPADAELIARYRKLARGLGDHERGQAEKALDRITG